MFALAPDEVLRQIADRARTARLSQGLTQATLAKRAGVSLGSLRRFEQTGRIALESLVQVAFALGAERDFEALFAPPAFERLDDVLASRPKRQRGRT